MVVVAEGVARADSPVAAMHEEAVAWFRAISRARSIASF
jgi:hypothetical protein